MKPITDIPVGVSNGTQAVITSITAQLPSMINYRCVVASKLDGAPRGLHVIGRLQRQFKLATLTDLLQSIKQLYDITFITAEVIESLEGVRMEKYQLDRTDIVTYVNNVITALKITSPSIDEVELISTLITSFEASQTNWILQRQDVSGGIHGDFVKLYKAVLTTEIGKLPLYVPNMMQVTSFDAYAKDAGLKNDERDRQAAIYRLSLIRIIDHVYSLLMEVDLWAAFVAPRTKADVLNNLERAKTLRVLAHYLQSLLMYPQFFALEATLKGYEQIQQWVQYFPPLAKETTDRIESIIRPHDVLGARDDVRTFMDSASAVGEKEANVMTLYSETITLYGLQDIITNIDAQIGKLTSTVTFNNLIELDDKNYLPLLSGIPVSDISVGGKVADAVLIAKAVDGQVLLALTNLLPTIAKGVTKETLAQLIQMQLRPNLAFTAPTAIILDVTRGARKEVSGGFYRIDRQAPSFSYDYHAYLRSSYKYVVALDTTIMAGRPNKNYNNVIDHDRAQELRDILATSWDSLVPSCSAAGSTFITAKSLKHGEGELRHLIEKMGGMTFELAVKEMSLMHRRRMWATFFSSFALLYSTNEAKRGGPFDVGDLVLVAGHGYPYGTSYTDLAAKQAPESLTAENLIELGEGFYLRVLDAIPIVSDHMEYDRQFYGHHSYTYFAASTAVAKVDKFLWGPGLTQLTMTPTPSSSRYFSAKFGTRFVYALRRLLLNFNVYYAPSVPSEAREGFPLNVTTRSWNLERDSFFLTYKTIGHYGSVSATSSAAGGDAQELPTLEALQRQVERAEVAEEQETGRTEEQVQSHITAVESKVTSEAAAPHKQAVGKDERAGKGHNPQPKKKKSGKSTEDDDDAEVEVL